MKAYRVRNWDRHFENNRTRELKRLEWVPVPNKHDGDGFTDLLDHKNGMAHYGAWHLILQVASKCDPRGTLLRDGADGVKTPHTASTLARITRGEEKAIKDAMDRLVSIGWLEIYDDPALIPHNPAPACGKVPMEWNGMEEKGREGKTLSDGFEIFWSEYPRKTAKKKAFEAWVSAKSKPPLADILQAIETQKKSEQWRKDNGQFIPHPATWLNQGRWDDKPFVLSRSQPLFKNRRTHDDWVTEMCLDLDKHQTGSKGWDDVIEQWKYVNYQKADNIDRVVADALDIMWRKRKENECYKTK